MTRRNAVKVTPETYRLIEAGMRLRSIEMVVGGDDEAAIKALALSDVLVAALLEIGRQLERRSVAGPEWTEHRQAEAYVLVDDLDAANLADIRDMPWTDPG